MAWTASVSGGSIGCAETTYTDCTKGHGLLNHVKIIGHAALVYESLEGGRDLVFPGTMC